MDPYRKGLPMKSGHAAFLTLCMAGFTISSPSEAAELMQGRCHMDYCSWFSIESREIVGSNTGGALFKAILKEWTSHHPKGDYGRRRPRTGGETARSYFFCSKTKPSAIWMADSGQWAAAILNVASPAGAEENAVIRYFAVCHGVPSGHDMQASFDALAARFGYASFEEGDLREIARPEDVLKE